MRSTVLAVPPLALGIALLVAGCDDGNYHCGPTAMYDPDVHLCVCRDGFLLADSGLCIPYDGGPLDCAGASPETVYDDADGDGFGRPGSEHLACPGTPETATNADDCDDTCAACHPGGTEVCDGHDDDCTAGPDDTFACVQGAATACTTACGTTGTTTCSATCTFPAECTPPTETCNTTDDDCDGAIDEGVSSFTRGPDWTTLPGFPILRETEDAIVAVFPGESERGLYAQRFGRDAEPIGAPVMLDSADMRGALVAIATAPAQDVAVAWSLSGMVRVAGLHAGDLHVVVAPRTIFSGAQDDLEIEHVAFGELAVVYGAPDHSIRMRALPSLSSSPGAERVLVPARTTTLVRFAAHAPWWDIGTFHVAYSDVPAAETDNEVFVISMRGTTGAASAPRRLTANDAEDGDPAIASSAGTVAVAWASSPSLTAAVGDTVLALLRAGSGASSPVVVSEPLHAPGTFVRQDLHLAASERGWLVAHGRTDGTGPPQRVLSIAAQDLSSVEADLAPTAPELGRFDIGVGLLNNADRPLLVFARLTADLAAGELRTYFLGCD